MRTFGQLIGHLLSAADNPRIQDFDAVVTRAPAWSLKKALRADVNQKRGFARYMLMVNGGSLDGKVNNNRVEMARNVTRSPGGDVEYASDSALPSVPPEVHRQAWAAWAVARDAARAEKAAAT